ncbi:MAG: Gfo/Idh/MocA family protein [Chloroflexota bacterium]
MTTPRAAAENPIPDAGTGAPVRVALVGCGYISEIYLTNAPRWGNVEIVALADIAPENARRRGEQFGLPAVTVAAALADSAVEAVLNLTIPAAHAEVALAAIRAGKSVYNEKPLAIALEDGRRIVEEARAAGVLVGCAPDTFLGAGLQTGRALLDAGAVGAPVGMSGVMLTPGHERWHPNPDFYYQPGGGPMFDMGPYYLTAMVSLLGPVARVAAMARASFPERTITSEPRAGERIPVLVNTHHAASLAFASGPIATLVTSFDATPGDAPNLELYGSEGTLLLPDPNTFGGPVKLRGRGGREWAEVPVARPCADNSRGLGLSDLAAALRTGRAPRASGDLALHVLEVMHAVEIASREERTVGIVSRPERPAPLPA